MNADKVSSPKISPGDVAEFFAEDTCGEARQKKSSLKRNMAWAEQQCSSSWVTPIRHFEESADESCSTQGSSEQKLVNTRSLRTHTNSLNIPASHFHGWLLTKMDTEGDVRPHSTHFSSQVTHLAKSSAGGKQQGLRVKTHLLSERF